MNVLLGGWRVSTCVVGAEISNMKLVQAANLTERVCQCG